MTSYTPISSNTLPLTANRTWPMLPLASNFQIQSFISIMSCQKLCWLWPLLSMYRKSHIIMIVTMVYRAEKYVKNAFPCWTPFGLWHLSYTTGRRYVTVKGISPSDLLCHAYSGAISFHVNGHFPCASGLASLRMSRPTFWTLLELRRMVAVVTTGAVRCALNCYHQQTNTQLSTGRMTFLSPNQQCQHWRKHNFLKK